MPPDGDDRSETRDPTPPEEASGEGPPKGVDGSTSCDRSAAKVAVTFGVMAMLMATATVLIAWLAASSSAGSLAALLLFGVLTFFFAIASLIALFKALSLTNDKSALGMPQGSIRAFMALVLIMLFFLMAVFLYLDVSRAGADRRVTGITEDSYRDLLSGGQVISAVSYGVPDPGGTNTEVLRWDVVLRAERDPNEVSEEMARQLITVLGTLIVAISAFYFGANSVQKAWREETTEQKKKKEEGLFGTMKTENGESENVPVIVVHGRDSISESPYIPPPAG